MRPRVGEVWYVGTPYRSAFLIVWVADDAKALGDSWVIRGLDLEGKRGALVHFGVVVEHDTRLV